MHLSVRQLQKILLLGSQAVAGKFTGVARSFVVLHLIELVDIRVRTVDDIYKSLTRNNRQGGVLLW